jgi:hypothetical protein
MDTAQLAKYFKTTKRTIFDWKNKGAPIENADDLTRWLRCNLRHTSAETKRVLERRGKIEALGDNLLKAWEALQNELVKTPDSAWEKHLGDKARKLSPVLGSLLLAVDPYAGTDDTRLQDQEYFHRLKAEPWPTSTLKFNQKKDSTHAQT